jgi:hypothetical protein
LRVLWLFGQAFLSISGQNLSMPLYRYSAQRGLDAVERTSLAVQQIRERQDLQRVLRHRIDVLGDDLLVVAEEYDMFDASRRRIDLLALDTSGTLVVIELKRTDDGGHMELQALRYAAMVSTMTWNQLVDAYAHYNQVDVEEAHRTIRDWAPEAAATGQLPNQVRIILVSQDFSTEITSTALWLNATYATDISCYRLTPYQFDNAVLLDVQQIIPLPEATDFQIQQGKKVAAAASTRAIRSGRHFTKYRLEVGGQSWSGMSKQAAVKMAVQRLHAAGVPLSRIQDSTNRPRWIALHPRPGEDLRNTFAREYPHRTPSNLWFDLDIVEDGVHWIMPRFGGLETEPMLAALQRACMPEVSLAWAPESSEDVPDDSLPL